ncbi:MAG: helix-turn-helix transcriptional regulator [Rickettsiales bacterium]|jgi:transcriptional regulator with XRE-family HTH domain|nr:helix-turn-helix transcriptional regulator [Rickettsiales bacterium]
MTILEAQKNLGKDLQYQRKALELTQAELSKRSGVKLATLRKFEQKGIISLASFLKLSMALGILDNIIKATKPQYKVFTSIDYVIKAKAKPNKEYF